MAEAKAPTQRLPVLGPEELWKELPEPNWIVDEVVRDSTLVELIAYGGSAKTWMAVDMVLSVATGEKWLGRFQCKQGPALIIDYENGNYELRRRLQSVARARGMEAPVAGVNAIITPPLYLQNDNTERVLKQLCEPYKLCVIDTLRAASPGVDENDSNIRAGLDMLKRVGEKTGCAFLILAHAKKGQPDDPREAGRGSSAIYDAADSVIYVRYEKGKPQTVQQTKARMGRYLHPFEVTVDDANGGVLIQSWDVGGMPSARERMGQGAAAGTEYQALKLVRQYPGEYSRTRLANEMTGEARQIRFQRVKKMVEQGQLDERESRLYIPGILPDEDYDDVFDSLLEN